VAAWRLNSTLVLCQFEIKIHENINLGGGESRKSAKYAQGLRPKRRKTTSCFVLTQTINLLNHLKL